MDENSGGDGGTKRNRSPETEEGGVKHQRTGEVNLEKKVSESEPHTPQHISVTKLSKDDSCVHQPQ